MHLSVTTKPLDDLMVVESGRRELAKARVVRDPGALSAPLLAALEDMEVKLEALGGQVGRDEIDEAEARGTARGAAGAEGRAGARAAPLAA